jgi:aminopeptidase N
MRILHHCYLPIAVALPGCKPHPQSGPDGHHRRGWGAERRPRCDIHLSQTVVARQHVDGPPRTRRGRLAAPPGHIQVPGRNTLTLDTSGLGIEQVTDQDGKALRYQPTRHWVHHVERAGLRTSEIPTAAEAAALQWLSPAQTAGKQQPYLFSQGEAILTRTWIPTQDSPGIRQTWTARIVAPEKLTVVMSAEMRGPEAATAGTRAWRFRMEQPVAPYLIAIAIGDLAFQSLGGRTGVYTEPSMLPAAAAELADVERMVGAAETLYGPYRWGRYDLLVLPPSFPYGGMENPRLTFATPTIIAGINHW